MTILGSRLTQSRRRGLADAIEVALDPQLAIRRGQLRWPRIPRRNRAAVEEPLRAAVVLLRDPAVPIDDALDELTLLVVAPDSALYGPYPNRARWVAHAAYDRLQALASPQAAVA